MDLQTWENKAKQYQMPHVHSVVNERLDKEPGALFSWVLHYDSLTKTKVGVDGFSIYLPQSRNLYLVINDPTHEVVEEWVLQTHGCKTAGPGKPVFIATNMDLSNSLQAA